DSERDNDVPFPAAPDTKAEVGEADQILPPSGSAGSQHTSSDKRSALPSDFQSPLLGDSGLTSTSETRLPPSVSCGDQPVPYSVSDSAVDREIPPRQRVSFDSDRRSSASPRPTYTGDSPHKQQGYRHSPKVSQTQKNSAKSSHSCTGSSVLSLFPSRAISPLRTFFDRFSRLGRVYSREEPFIPIDPFRFHTSLSLNPIARYCEPRPQHRVGDIEEGAPLSQSDISCTCACVPLFGSAHFHNVHIFTFDMLTRQFYLHAQLCLPLFYFSRVLRISQDAAVSRPELQRIIDACEAVGTDDAQYRTTGAVLPFPEDWVPPNVSPALARFKLSWEGFVTSLVRVEDTQRAISFTSFSYPDPVPDSGRGERSRADDSHSALYISCASTTCAACTVRPAGPRYVARRPLTSVNRKRQRQKQPYSGTSGSSSRCPASGSPEVGRKARVVQRLADVTIELESRGRDDARVRAPRAAERTSERERGRSRANDGVEEKARTQTGNELGLSGMDRKQEATVTVTNGGDLANDSYSSLGM
ncbi:hypothetical protein V8E53_010969, partial [Lactarius tabidus]